MLYNFYRLKQCFVGDLLLILLTKNFFLSAETRQNIPQFLSLYFSVAYDGVKMQSNLLVALA